MSNPTNGHWKKLKRLGRYLKNNLRTVTQFKYQESTNWITIWSDTDWAGCKKTRKSTSGGIVMFGGHLIKSWSTTQDLIALSSGEAEYYGLVKGSAIGLGIRSMMRDLGVNKM